MASGPFPILYFAPSSLSDAILSSGVFKRLHDEVENASFTVVADAVTAPLFREAPKREATIAPAGPGLAGSFGLWRRLRRRRWGLVLDAAGVKLSARAPARQRARIDELGGAPAHKVVRAARLLRLEEAPPAPHLFTSAQTEARARGLVGEEGPVLALAPGAGWLGRTWPTERYARVAARLLADPRMEGGRLLIVGASEDRRAAEALRGAIPRGRWIDLTSEADPLVIHACLKQARLFLGGAVPFTHLAAAAGAPTLGLFGPDNEAVDGPWGACARVIRGPRSYETIRALDPAGDQPVCHMLDLSVDAVLAAALRLLDETVPSGQKRGHG